MPDGYSSLADRIQKGLIGYGEAKRGLAREGLAGAKMQYDIAGEETRRAREAEKYKLERPGLQLQQQQKEAELKAYNSPINISEMVQDKAMTKEALPAVSRLVNLSNKMFGTEYRDGFLLKPGLEGVRESLTVREFHEGGGTEALAAIITQDQEPRSDTVEGHQEILRILQRGKGILVSVGAPEEYIKSMDSAIGRTDKRIETLRKKPKMIDPKKLLPAAKEGGLLRYTTEKGMVEIPGTEGVVLPTKAPTTEAGKLAKELGISREAAIKRIEKARRAPEKVPTLKQGKNPATGANEWFYLSEKNKPVFTGVEVDKIDPAKKAALQMISGNLILSAKFATMPIPDKKKLIESMASFFEEGVSPKTIPETGLPKGLTEKDIQYNIKKYKKTRQEVIDRYLKR